jgi:lipid II isoglutaminyl synthase (glutamine-hydrolysing)
MSSNKQQIVNSKSLTIGWLYPDLMSTYGDRGNIMVLQKRCLWRGIKTEIVNIDQNTSENELKNVNILFGGGAQDKEQNLVINDLVKKSGIIKELIENNVPSLFVCGSPQLLGKYYEPAFGKRIEGLGIFDITSVHPGPQKDRLIGNVIAKINWENLIHQPSAISHQPSIVGFENHGGRTILGKNAKPFATVIKGFGNNGEDGTEGVIYKNAIGSYLHGPLLPKNPEIADWLIKKALEIKYKTPIDLEPLDKRLEEKAKNTIAKSLNIKL